MISIKHLALLVGANLVLVCGCQPSKQAAEFSTHFVDCSIGATKADAEILLGKPYNKHVRETLNTTYWVYKNDGKIFALRFFGDEVDAKYMMEQTEADTVVAYLKELNDACIQYVLQVGTLPKSLADLHTRPVGLTARKWRGPYIEDASLQMDPWGKPYEYTVTNEETGSYMISNDKPTNDWFIQFSLLTGEPSRWMQLIK